MGFNSGFKGLRKADNNPKHNSLTSTILWLTPTRALSPSHTRPWPPMWVVTLRNLFLYSDPPLSCHPPSYWLRLFSSQTFSHIKTPTFSNLVILHTYPPMKMEQTECSETSAYKIQTLGNYPEGSIQQEIICFRHQELFQTRFCDKTRFVCCT